MTTDGKIVLGHDLDVHPGKPIAVTREFLGDGHMHVRGRTRSGKTSRALLPLAIQLMQPYEEDGVRKRDPIFIFDLGGDLALFNFVREAAEKAGRTFRFLSLHPDDDSHSFDPFQAVPAGQRDVMRVTTLLIEAFNLDNGLIYGGQYFTAQNLAALLSVVRKLSREEGKRLTLQDVALYLDREGRGKKIRDADQIRMTFNFLLEYPQLLVDDTTDPARTIDMARALESGEVVYFFAPTLSEMTTARQIAGLGLYNLVYAAMQRARNDLPLVRAWTFIDEFHELTGKAFEALLAQSAKFGVSLILANQTTSQLESRDSSLHQIVFDNSHVKLYFTVTCQQDIEDLQGLSEDYDKWLPGSSSKGLVTSTTGHAVETPQLSKNDILQVSATEGHGFLIIDDGSGHHEPYRAEIPYHIQDKPLYMKARHTPIPRRPPRDPERADAAVLRAAVRGALVRAPDPERRRLMLDLLAKKREAETIDGGTAE